MTRRWVALFGVVALGFVQCGGSTNSDGTSGGTAGTGGGVGGSGGGVGGSGGSGVGGVGGGSGGTTSPDMFACQVNSDCLLRSASCCGSCGAATREDSIAINKQFSAQYASQNCEAVDCPGCFMPQDPTLLATCRGGQCTVVDLLTHPATECQSPNDCRPRTTDCCECGAPTDPEHLIAISVSGDLQYSQLVCDPAVGCDDCLPNYPPVSIGCIDNHCQLVTGT